jgi:sortase A
MLLPTTDDAATRIRARLTASASRAWQHVLVLSAVLAGLAVMLYPAGATWFSSIDESAAVALHAEAIENAGSKAVSKALKSADAYNAGLTRGLLVDPFGTHTPADAVLDEDALRYLDELSIDEAGVMGSIRIPKIGVDLPIYHGATEETLRQGIGHLYGSSLPIGGESTHAVLTGHSGLPEAPLFTDIRDLEIGDEFFLDVYGRQLSYRVSLIDTIDPTDTQNLHVEPGKDLVTLITCTPIGVNTHRLIVEGERTFAEPPPDTGPPAPDFPWWAVGIGAALLVWLAALIYALRLGHKLRRAGGKIRRPRRARAPRRA